MAACEHATTPQIADPLDAKRILEIEVIRQRGRHAEALHAIEVLADHAEEVDDPPFVAQFLLLHGTILRDLGRPPLLRIEVDVPTVQGAGLPAAALSRKWPVM